MKVTSREAVRLKLLVPSEKLTLPEHGHYASSAEVAAKLKFPSSRQMVFREERQRQEETGAKQMVRQRAISKMEEGEIEGVTAKKGLVVDYNLPEL
jgi:hypothetical protein